MEDVVYMDNGQSTDPEWACARVDTLNDQKKVLAMVGKKVVIIETGDWTVIPLENMIAQTDGPLSVGKFRDFLTVCESASLEEIKVVSVKPLEMGDKVYVGTCSLMNSRRRDARGLLFQLFFPDTERERGQWLYGYLPVLCQHRRDA